MVLPPLSGTSSCRGEGKCAEAIEFLQSNGDELEADLSFLDPPDNGLFDAKSIDVIREANGDLEKCARL
jgi:hypothetical protein